MGIAIIDSMRVGDVINRRVRLIRGYKREIARCISFVVPCLEVEWIGAIYIPTTRKYFLDQDEKLAYASIGSPASAAYIVFVELLPNLSP